MAKTFYLTLDISMKVEVPIKADSLEGAMEKAEKEDYELPNLNDGYITETCMKYMRDENYNLAHDYKDE